MRAAGALILLPAFLLIAGTAPAAPVSQEAPVSDLLGTWDVETEDGAFSFVWEFTLEDGILKGLYSGRSGDAEMQELKFEDNMLEFRVDVGMEISFSASIDRDYMEGTLSLEFGEAAFTGKKRT